MAEGIEWPKVMPRTPDVTALEKFGNYPIGYQTGTVNISVPLFSVNIGHDMVLPIDLLYHSSGIKVAESPSRVGLGWVLNAGGYISRELRGQNDEMRNSGFYDFSQHHIGHTIPRDVFPDSNKPLLDSIDSGLIDTEADIFNVSLPNRNFKFFCGSDGNFHCIPFSNVKITQTAMTNNNGSGYWLIVDERGFKYYFGQYNSCNAIEYSENAENGNKIATAWKLIAIVSPENKLLAQFDYMSCDYYNTSQRQIYKFMDTQVSNICSNWSGADYIFGLRERTSSYNFDGLDLSCIQIPGIGQMSFRSRIPRLQGTSIIDQITFSDSLNERNWGYSLYYDDTSRCFLMGIDKFDSNEDRELYRRFTYFSGLPTGKNHKGQDLWGYYNGAQNSNLFPVTSYINHLGAFEMSDRYPNENASCGSLKEILYPTGGKTTFEYSNNDVFVSNHHDTIYSIRILTQELCTGTLNYYEGDWFTQATNSGVEININFGYYPEIETILFELVDTNGICVAQYDGSSLAISGNRIGTGTSPYQFSCRVNTLLSPGRYRWIVRHEFATQREHSVSPANIQTIYSGLVENPVGSTNTKRVGGIRINKICNYDTDGTLIDTRKYTYTNSNGESSGSEGPSPFFVRHTIDRFVPEIGSGAAVCDNMFVGVEEVGEENLCRYSGSPVLYSEVTEDIIAAGKTLRTTYCYKNRNYGYTSIRSNLFRNEQTIFPFDENNYQEGLLLSRTLYEQSNTGFKKRQKEEYKYDVLESAPSAYVQTSLAFQNMAGGFQDPRMSPFDYYYCGTYLLNSSKVLPCKTTVTRYVGTDSIVTVNNNYFENPQYIQPTKTEQYINPSEKFITNYRYCYDVSNNNVLSQMIERNIIATPIEVKITHKGKMQTTKTEYSSFGYGVIAPSETATICQGDTSKIEFLHYDSYGNVQHARINGVLDRFYLWSYSGKLLIAEIVGGNYTFTDISNAVYSTFYTTIDGLSRMFKPNPTKLRDGNLQNRLPSAEVTTVTYHNSDGIATVTNPNGVTVSYEYDAFSRLISKKVPIIRQDSTIGDAIHETYQYHYHTPNNE